ncbi:MAG TPA: helix-turn-helix domain-containing protein [Armatimonadota bacterium]|nr:helix-turn-helix domain-containing protein [Armatimonadota bacterium]
MTEREVAEFLALKPETLRQYRYDGKGPPYYKIAGTIRYRLPELEQYLFQRRHCPAKTKRGGKNGNE